jgi:hypothetical protein
MSIDRKNLLSKVAITALTLGLVVGISKGFRAQAKFNPVCNGTTCNYFLGAGTCLGMQSGCMVCTFHSFTSSTCGTGQS